MQKNHHLNHPNPTEKPFWKSRNPFTQKGSSISPHPTNFFPQKGLTKSNKCAIITTVEVAKQLGYHPKAEPAYYDVILFFCSSPQAKFTILGEFFQVSLARSFFLHHRLSKLNIYNVKNVNGACPSAFYAER